jgi:LL-diaminopimelate aminotransferase
MADLPAVKREMRARGVDLIDLGVGDADLAPPPSAVRALQAAAEDPVNSRYSFQIGLAAFRDEIAAFMRTRFAVALDPLKEVLPIIGSKDGLFHFPFALLDPGDLAIIPDPGYQAYLGGTVLAGGEPYLVPLRAEHDFLIPLDRIPGDIARRAKILYLNYPNNPTTAVAPRSYLEDAVAFCRENDVVLAYDNAYSEVAFDGYRPPSILEIAGAREVAVEFHSLSKTYNMTGWRVGWAAGDAGWIGALARVKTFADTGVPLTMQHAAVAALRERDRWLPGNLEVFRRRRDAAVRSLRDAGLVVTVPSATMYLWIALPGGESSEAFARRLLRDEGVAVMPGSALGAGGEGYFRIALTVPEERLREAFARIASLLENPAPTPVRDAVSADDA